MRIALDAMGGDNAPDEIIAGAIEAVELLSENDELILVGPENIIEPQLPNSCKRIISIVDAPDIIGMDEPPIESLQETEKLNRSYCKTGQTWPGRCNHLRRKHRRLCRSFSNEDEKSARCKPPGNSGSISHN